MIVANNGVTATIAVPRQHKRWGELGTGAFFFNGGTLETTSGLSLPTGMTLNALGGTFLALGGSNSTLRG